MCIFRVSKWLGLTPWMIWNIVASHRESSVLGYTALTRKDPG